MAGGIQLPNTNNAIFGYQKHRRLALCYHYHCVKSVHIRRFPVRIFRIWTEYGEIQSTDRIRTLFTQCTARSYFKVDKVVRVTMVLRCLCFWLVPCW